MKKNLFAASLFLVMGAGSLFAQVLTGFGSSQTNPINPSDVVPPWTGTVTSTNFSVSGVSNAFGGIQQPFSSPITVTETTKYLTLTGVLGAAPAGFQNFTIVIYDSTLNNTRSYQFAWNSFSSAGSSVTGTLVSSQGTFNGSVGGWELDLGGNPTDTVSFTFDQLAFTATSSTGTGTTKQTITFPTIPNQTFGAAPITLNATASSGLAVSYSLVSGPATLSGTNDDTVTITGVGTVVIQASQAGNGTYAAAANVNKTFTVKAGLATVTLGSLATTYNGSQQPVTATTTPPGLNVTFTYGGKTTVPTNAGSYAVVATVTGPDYTGSAKGTLVIGKATAIVNLESLNAFYNGSGHAATAMTTPSGLDVTFTYNGKATLPVNLGSYTVIGTVSNANYTGNASGTLTISIAPAVVYVGATGAEVTEGVDPSGVATSIYYQYGPTTSYGSQTATQSLGSGKVPVNVFALFPGLLPNTTYHDRLETVTSAGTINGPDETFTTPSFDTQLVVAKGTAATGTTFASFGNPAVNVDDTVAFAGTLTLASGVTSANDMGIWTIDNTNTQTLVARIGSAAPGTGGDFLTLTDPVFNDSSAVAFKGTLKALAGQVTTTNATGVWSSSSGSLALVARQGSAAPGTSGTFATFTSLGLSESAGAVLFATLNAGTGITTANNSGIWEGNTTSDLALKLRLGQTVGGKTVTKLTFLPVETYVNGQTRGFNATGDLVSGATFSDKTTGIVTVVSGTPAVAEVSGTSATGIASANFATFGNPIINNSDKIAFAATVTGGGATTADNSGIWADDSTGTLQLIARTGSGIAPGTTAATFATFNDPVFNSHEAVAFRATLKGATTATETGIWCNSGGSLALVAQEGVTPAPGCPAGATFATFTELALPDQGGATNKGGVIFLGTLNANAAAGVTTTNNTGIWAVDSTGALQLIARTGDVVNVGTNKTITSLAFLPAETTVNGQTRSFDQTNGDIVYLATFSDKSTAILNVVF